MPSAVVHNSASDRRVLQLLDTAGKEEVLGGKQVKTFETAKEAQSEADKLNLELIPQQRIAKVYLTFPAKRWGIEIIPFEYKMSEKTLREMYSLTKEEQELSKFIPISLIYMARHMATMEQRNRMLPYQGSMTDISKLAAAAKRRAKEIPYHNPRQEGAQCKFIHAITYQCVDKANIGICARPHPESELWRHEWKDNRNRMCSADGRRFLYKKGEIVEIGKAIVNNTGINDWHKPTVFENTSASSKAKPSRLIGELVSIEFTDGSQIEPSGYNLMSDTSGRKLYIQPKKNPIFMVRGWSDKHGEYGQPVFADTPVQAAAKVKKVYPEREIHSVHKIAENGVSNKTLLFFYMKQCTHCQAMKKWIDTLPIKVVKIDCDEKPELVEKHKIQYTPTVVLIGERSSKKQTGEMTKAELLKFIG